MKPINLLILVLLVSSSLEMKFKAVTDSEFIITNSDMLQIQREIKNIENVTGIQVTLFMMSSMRFFKQSNNLPVYLNDMNIEAFTDGLYEAMYRGSPLGDKSILVVISVNDRLFRARTGEYARRYATDATVMGMFQNVRNYMIAGNYSTAARVYIHDLNLHLTYKPPTPSGPTPYNPSGPSSYNDSSYSGWSILIILLILACCCGCCFMIAGAAQSSDTTVSYAHNSGHYDEFTGKMNRLRDINAAYSGSNMFYDYCVLCFEDFSGIRPASSLSCGHRFHSGCLQAIILRGGNCPTCVNNWHTMNRDQFICSMGTYHMEMYPGLGNSYNFRWDNGNYYMDSYNNTGYNNNAGYDAYGNQDRGVSDYNYGTNVNYGGNYGGTDAYGNQDRGVNDYNYGTNANYGGNYGGTDAFGNQERGVNDYNYGTNANYDTNQNTNNYYREMEDRQDQNNEEDNQGGGTAGW